MRNWNWPLVSVGAILTTTPTTGTSSKSRGIYMRFMQYPMILSTIKNVLCANEPDVSMCCCQVITAADHLFLKHSHPLPQSLLCLHVIQCVARQFLSFCMLVLFFVFFSKRELSQQPSKDGGDFCAAGQRLHTKLLVHTGYRHQLWIRERARP